MITTWNVERGTWYFFKFLLSKIIYFSRRYTPHDRRFLSALAKTDHKIHYISLENSRPLSAQHPLPPEVRSSPGLSPRDRVTFSDYPALLSELQGIIAAVKPDLIHAGPIQRCAFPVALLDFQPLVSVSWGYDLIREAKTDTMWRWITEYTLEHSAVMVGDCSTIRQLAISYGMPDERIITFPWGINLDHFTPAGESHKIPASVFTILSTRGWEPIYGVDTIVQAFALAGKSNPDLRLVLLGGGSMESDLRAIVAEAGVEDQVEFRGLVDYNQLPDYFRSADIFVSASHSDGTSISLLEALACGTPALVSDIPGNREWISSGVNGWFFPLGDVEALAQSMIRARDLRLQLPEMGRAARLLAEQRADWNANFPQLLRAYELALGNE